MVLPIRSEERASDRFGDSPGPPAPKLANGSPTFAHVATDWPGWPETRPTSRRRVVRRPERTVGGLGYLALANLPRSLLVNLESLALVVISRRIAEYSVAAGVLPPGLVQ